MTEIYPASEYATLVRGKSKYPSRKVIVEGVKLDSAQEGRRYQELVLMQKADLIWGLEVHPKYDFVVNEVWVGSYTADFRYHKRGEFTWTVEDVKSEGTKRARDWPLRRNLMRACHGIEVRET